MMKPADATSAARQDLLAKILAEFPSELIALDQWVVWRLVKRSGKLTKVPYQAGGAPASTTKKASWSSCQDAMLAYGADASLDGVGFVFSADDPYVGIDLDKCRDPDTGMVEPWATEILNSIKTYTELSPSGKGFHLIGKGKLPSTGKRKDRVEMYDSGRYFTVTGDRCSADGVGAENVQTSLLRLHGETFGVATKAFARKKAANDPSASAVPTKAGDLAVVGQILASSDKKSFEVLSVGDWAVAGYESQSEADLALAGILARHAGQQPDQIDRIFRTTGLMREKWDEMRGAQTYGAMTIEKALSSVSASAAEAAFVAKMNDRFAVVQNNSQVRILDVGRAGGDFRLLNSKDFALLTASTKSPGKGTAAQIWLRSPLRREYNGIVFSPGREVPGMYNLWRGFAVKPAAGNCSLYKQLILEAICAGCRHRQTPTPQCSSNSVWLT
jgi:primase-polymerase (primpol)-like protein